MKCQNIEMPKEAAIKVGRDPKVNSESTQMTIGPALYTNGQL